MTHVTERSGSPQTLVCTKDRRSFQLRLKEYEREIVALRTLIKLVPNSKTATSLSVRMQAAAAKFG
jgi:hypothetical protein